MKLSNRNLGDLSEHSPQAPKDGVSIWRLAPIFFVALSFLTQVACVSTKCRIVTPEYLAGFEGGGSLLTLWYEGSDDRYHYFNRLHKVTTRFRVLREDMNWENEFELGSRELTAENSLVRREFSNYLKIRESTSH